MKLRDILIPLMGLLLLTHQQVDGLKCYKCSSLLDSACSDEWELTSSEAAKFEVECSSSAEACQKIVGEIQGTGEQHVYRQCWNQTGTENYIPTGCEEDEVRGGVVCRCTADICNGQQRLLPSECIYIALISCAEIIRQYYYSRLS